jgi:hypothetical protein
MDISNRPIDSNKFLRDGSKWLESYRACRGGR